MSVALYCTLQVLKITVKGISKFSGFFLIVSSVSMHSNDFWPQMALLLQFATFLAFFGVSFEAHLAIGRIRSSRAVGLRASVSIWLLAKGTPLSS